ncbi:transcription cofactor vestigial-like protein 2b [Pygocentrus nattereri]|uniref:Vestigial-like family member 2b n=1 Tax=Pygocentrus nattereri TaxID=42514 RepID=A0A3B4C4B6_PYGNA|nr:transcription cofactor vestigial-like protein 2b [Pygocentrus nattereri]
MSCLDVARPLYSHQAAFSSAAQTLSAMSSPSLPSIRRDSMDSSGSELPSGGQKEKQEVAEAEYLSSRCVLFTYFQGDISSVVDEHFSRALSSCSDTQGKRRGQSGAEAASPDSRRSFPPSFWDSNYPPLPSRLHCDPTGAPAYSMDPYAQGLHPGLPHAHPHPHRSDSWGYTQTQAYGPPRPLHELYSPPGLEPHYSPLLMPAVRPPHLPTLPGHYDVGKLEPTPTWPLLPPPGDMAIALNMDPGLPPHKKGKELYWF